MLACAYPALDRPMILFQDVVASRYFCSPLSFSLAMLRGPKPRMFLVRHSYT